MTEEEHPDAGSEPWIIRDWNFWASKHLDLLHGDRHKSEVARIAYEAGLQNGLEKTQEALEMLQDPREDDYPVTLLEQRVGQLEQNLNRFLRLFNDDTIRRLDAKHLGS